MFTTRSYVLSSLQYRFKHSFLNNFFYNFSLISEIFDPNNTKSQPLGVGQENEASLSITALKILGKKRNINWLWGNQAFCFTELHYLNDYNFLLIIGKPIFVLLELKIFFNFNYTKRNFSEKTALAEKVRFFNFKKPSFATQTQPKKLFLARPKGGSVGKEQTGFRIRHFNKENFFFFFKIKSLFFTKVGFSNFLKKNKIKKLKKKDTFFNISQEKTHFFDFKMVNTVLVQPPSVGYDNLFHKKTFYLKNFNNKVFNFYDYLICAKKKPTCKTEANSLLETGFGKSCWLRLNLHPDWLNLSSWPNFEFLKKKNSSYKKTFSLFLNKQKILPLNLTNFYYSYPKQFFEIKLFPNPKQNAYYPTPKRWHLGNQEQIKFKSSIKSKKDWNFFLKYFLFYLNDLLIKNKIRFFKNTFFLINSIPFKNLQIYRFSYFLSFSLIIKKSNLNFESNWKSQPIVLFLPNIVNPEIEGLAGKIDPKKANPNKSNTKPNNPSINPIQNQHKGLAKPSKPKPMAWVWQEDLAWVWQEGWLWKKLGRSFSVASKLDRTIRADSSRLLKFIFISTARTKDSLSTPRGWTTIKKLKRNYNENLVVSLNNSNPLNFNQIFLLKEKATSFCSLTINLFTLFYQILGLANQKEKIEWGGGRPLDKKFYKVKVRKKHLFFIRKKVFFSAEKKTLKFLNNFLVKYLFYWLKKKHQNNKNFWVFNNYWLFLEPFAYFYWNSFSKTKTVLVKKVKHYLSPTKSNFLEPPKQIQLSCKTQAIGLDLLGLRKPNKPSPGGWGGGRPWQGQRVGYILGGGPALARSAGWVYQNCIRQEGWIWKENSVKQKKKLEPKKNQSSIELSEVLIKKKFKTYYLKQYKIDFFFVKKNQYFWKQPLPNQTLTGPPPALWGGAGLGKAFGHGLAKPLGVATNTNYFSKANLAGFIFNTLQKKKFKRFSLQIQPYCKTQAIGLDLLGLRKPNKPNPGGWGGGRPWQGQRVVFLFGLAHLVHLNIQNSCPTPRGWEQPKSIYKMNALFPLSLAKQDFEKKLKNINKTYQNNLIKSHLSLYRFNEGFFY